MEEERVKRVLIDQDAFGPADSKQMSVMVLLQSPQVEVLGIAIVTGNAWRHEEVHHTLPRGNQRSSYKGF
jgi:purine nucleosidase